MKSPREYDLESANHALVRMRREEMAEERRKARSAHQAAEALGRHVLNVGSVTERERVAFLRGFDQGQRWKRPCTENLERMTGAKR